MSKNMKIKGYIPLGAPLIWESAGEDESAGRTFISFTTNWYAQRAGVDFSAPYHTDPVYRFRALRKMKDVVRGVFPEAVCFREHDSDGYERECATVSGVFGVCLVAMLYGLKPEYSPNNWPAISPNNHLTVEQIKALGPFDIRNHPVVEVLFEQMDTIQNKYGIIDGFLNFQGVLNNAFKIRGSNILIDIISDPGLCHHLFEHITDTMMQLAKLCDERQGKAEPRSDFFVTSNCVVNMISPEHYREFILPYDLKIADSFEGFGIHSCNWILDPYIDLFRRAENLGYIDFGFHSNHARINEAFAGVRKTVFYDPMRLVTRRTEEIREDIELLHGSLTDYDLCLPDVDLLVPDEKIREFISIADDIQK